MSTESNIAWALLAFGLLTAGGGYAAGRKLHGPDKDMVNARKAASRNMDEIDAFIREIKLREKEIAAKGGVLGHGELGMPEAERTYYKDRVKELNGKLSTLRSAYAILTKSQRGRLERQANVDYKAIAPTVARQSHIEHVPQQARIEHKPQQGPSRSESIKERWKDLRRELQSKHRGDLDKWTAEIKAHPLTAELKQKENSYWLQQVANVKQLA